MKKLVTPNANYRWILVLGLLLTHSVWAQFTIKGHVFSGKNQEPLPFATVFLSGTSKGTLTDSSGQFVLTNLPPGTFDLIVSFVGFTTLKTTLQTQQVKAYRFILKPLENNLGEITVKAHRRRDWSKEIALFTDNFIGVTQNAKACRLLNPSVLRFVDSPSTLEATAPEPLLIENSALGYRLKFHLDKFTYDYGQQRIAYQGYPLFEPLPPKNQQQAEEWKANRRKAYLGSLMHFMRALYQKRLVPEGFVIQQIAEKKNRAGERRFIGLPTDSTAYFPSLTNSTKQVAYPMAPYKMILDSVQSTALRPVIAFNDWIQVTYALKREPADYQKYRETPENKYAIIPQRSFLRMLAPNVELESSGRFDLQRIFFEGYWTWELMAESLPIDYEPGD
ncbi:carboxypeptidase-like regulatory domain-containing protein [Spirosoma arboris]|nr:carboxypeptidase-like regulatory domain-containing protein [Spirosoma arboris]